MFDDVEQYLHLWLLKLWSETKKRVRAQIIFSLPKSFFLQRVSHLATHLKSEVVCMHVGVVIVVFVFGFLLWLLPLSLPSLLSLSSLSLVCSRFSPRLPDEQTPGHRATYGVLATAPATVVVLSYRPSRRPVHPKESRHLHLQKTVIWRFCGIQRKIIRNELSKKQWKRPEIRNISFVGCGVQ